jgi:hypothetical protein
MMRLEERSESPRCGRVYVAAAAHGDVHHRRPNQSPPQMILCDSRCDRSAGDDQEMRIWWWWCWWVCQVLGLNN